MKEVFDQLNELMAQELILMQYYSSLNEQQSVNHHYDELVKLYCLNATLEKALEEP